jgi:hypothetical protein
VTQLLQWLRDEIVRRDYAAPTIRGYLQIVEAGSASARARLDRITRPPAPTLFTCSYSRCRAEPEPHATRYSRTYSFRFVGNDTCG